MDILHLGVTIWQDNFQLSYIVSCLVEFLRKIFQHKAKLAGVVIPG